MTDVDQLLDGGRIKKQLLDASLFLLAYELLKASIIDGVKDFFLVGFDESGLIYSEEYETQVLPKAVHVFEASLIFLVEVEAISENDKSTIQGLRKYRNEIAHDIPTAVFQIDKPVDLDQLELAGYYLHKIDNFWGRIEVETDLDLLEQDVDFEGITSVRSQVYQYIVKVAQDGI